MNDNGHKHPHGVENTMQNPERVWICEECNASFADEEVRRDIATGEWGHKCKSNPRKPYRCESHLDPFVLDIKVLEKNKAGEYEGDGWLWETCVHHQGGGIGFCTQRKDGKPSDYPCPVPCSEYKEAEDGNQGRT